MVAVNISNKKIMEFCCLQIGDAFSDPLETYHFIKIKSTPEGYNAVNIDLSEIVKITNNQKVKKFGYSEIRLKE